eukprot:TRINITY_DN6115_c0_g1_i7.p2 TRINITY_DN6115_c0_g1~~TRINITY_DN6115_c0_g1_i7.p2  ORF type:complete len:128 (+),score=31.14 TRINITY_DN6115_c0_g1_i7:459-842(+)
MTAFNCMYWCNSDRALEQVIQIGEVISSITCKCQQPIAEKYLKQNMREYYDKLVGGENEEGGKVIEEVKENDQEEVKVKVISKESKKSNKGEKSVKRSKHKCCSCGNEETRKNIGCDCIFCADCLQK